MASPPVHRDSLPFPKSSIKYLSESTNLTSVPSNYAFPLHDNISTDPVISQKIPTIDFSLLTSATPDQRSQIVCDLGRACREWGFFMLINHGVEERLRERMLDTCRAFFDLPEAEKREYIGKHVLDPIRYGTSFNPAVEKAMYWRDYLKVIVHPVFHSADKPAGFRYDTISKIVGAECYDGRGLDTTPACSELGTGGGYEGHRGSTVMETSLEYCTKIREVVKELLRGISESLGLEDGYIDKALQLEAGLQMLLANLYPKCPQPELAMGMPPHSDHGLLTILMQNEASGFQLQHKGKWVHVDPLPNSFLVNTGDHMEILSNGMYKSVLHRAVVNSESTRISIGIAHGPSLDASVVPAPQLVDIENYPPAYHGMKYRDYIEIQQNNQLNGKSCLDLVRTLTV